MGRSSRTKSAFTRVFDALWSAFTASAREASGRSRHQPAIRALKNGTSPRRRQGVHGISPLKTGVCALMLRGLCRLRPCVFDAPCTASDAAAILRFARCTIADASDDPVARSARGSFQQERQAGR